MLILIYNYVLCCALYRFLDGIIRFNLWEFDSGDAMLAYELTIIEGTQEDTTYGVEPITDSTHNELALDGDTVHPSAATSVWRGQLSIALHHTYQVCYYVNHALYIYISALSLSCCIGALLIHKSM